MPRRRRKSISSAGYWPRGPPMAVSIRSSRAIRPSASLFYRQSGGGVALRVPARPGRQRGSHARGPCRGLCLRDAEGAASRGFRSIQSPGRRRLRAVAHRYFRGFARPWPRTRDARGTPGDAGGTNDVAHPLQPKQRLPRCAPCVCFRLPGSRCAGRHRGCIGLSARRRPRISRPGSPTRPSAGGSGVVRHSGRDRSPQGSNRS